MGACYPSGKKYEKRRYTDEQTQLFLCLSWMRRIFPRIEITYQSLRNFWQSNEYKIEEIFDKCCEDCPEPKTDEIRMVALSKVKSCCDAIANGEIPRNCWSRWKQHLQIAPRSKYVEKGKASLLVYMACWRHDNPNKRFPSMVRLQIMMQSSYCPQLSLETASSGKMRYQWAMQGCKGKDLPRYLASQGFKVALTTLYKWGNFSQRKHYSVSELAEWKKIASQKRCA